MLDRGSTAARTVSLTSAAVQLAPVQDVKTLPLPDATVGYLLFTDHVAPAERAVFDAITQLRDAGITDLILDLRYNSGGFLDIASELAFMIAGPTATAGKTFLRVAFNDKHPMTDPVTGAPLTPLGRYGPLRAATGRYGPLSRFITNPRQAAPPNRR